MNEPSVRYRGKYALDWLSNNHKITYSFIYPSYNLANILNFLRVWIELIFFRKKESVIFFENIYTNRIYAKLLKLLLLFTKQGTVYDIDDADYLRYPPSTIHFFMKNVSICSVGSSALYHYASRFNKNCLLLTTPIIKHDIVKKERSSPFTVGWIGYYNAHQESLKRLFFPAIFKIDFPIKFVLLGVTKVEHEEYLRETFSQYPLISLETPRDLDWQNEESIYLNIIEFDCGISPLLDTDFNRAKSAFKLKQYLSCGVPALCSPVGENNVFLKHGENGFICSTEEEYLSALKKMKKMSDSDYRKMSNSARKSYHYFDMSHYSNTIINYFQ